MKNGFKFLFSFTILLSVPAFAGGVSIGNGGDVVRCAIDGYYYSLDYLMVRKELQNAGEIRFKRVGDSLNRIQVLLTQKLPKLESSFREYRGLLNNYSDFSKPYVWAARNDLPDISDEQFVNVSGCYSWYYKGQFLQAVVRKVVGAGTPAPRVVFEFDPEVMNAVSKQALQHSFLIVHEWLWNMTKNADQNRKLNYFLHSQLFDTYSSAQVKAYFEQAGVKLQ